MDTTEPTPPPQRWQSRREILNEYLDSLSPDEMLRSHPYHWVLRYGPAGYARKYDPDQPRVPAGNTDGGQWTTVEGVWTRYAELGHNIRPQNPAIEETTQKLQDTLVKVNQSVSRRRDPMSARLYGIAVHTEFARAVRAQNLPGIGTDGVEQSFDWDGVKRYGMDGSIRTDVVLRDEKSNIIAIYDVKTGDATMWPARELRIRAMTRVGPEVPLIIMRARRVGP